jgi:hypothetical protein
MSRPTTRTSPPGTPGTPGRRRMRRHCRAGNQPRRRHTHTTPPARRMPAPRR